MTKFWSDIIEPGYYDRALKNGKLLDRNVQSVWHHTTFSKISKKINKDDYLLDYACGPATFTGQYLNQNQKPLCVDLSVSQISYASKRYSDKGIYKDISEFNFDDYFDKFDVITCLGLFEFISTEEGIKLLNKFYKMLNKDGKLFITTPNFKLSMLILEFFLNRFGSLDYSKEYKSRYVPKTLRRMISNTEFKINTFEKYMTPMVFLSIFGNKIGIKTNKYLQKLTFNKYGYLLFVHLEK